MATASARSRSAARWPTATAGCRTPQRAVPRAAALRRTLAQLHEERRRRDLQPLDTIYKLHVSDHADPALEREAAELASLGFNEILVQGIWDAGLDAGVAAIARVRRVLDV